MMLTSIKCDTFIPVLVTLTHFQHYSGVGNAKKKNPLVVGKFCTEHVLIFVVTRSPKYEVMTLACLRIIDAFRPWQKHV